MKPITRIHDRQLSLWQSSVIAAAHANLKATNSKADMTAIQAHPMVQAVSDHVQAVIKGEEIPKPSPDSAEHSSYMSSLFFEIAKAEEKQAHGIDQTQRIKDLQVEVRKYSTKDINILKGTGWATCKLNYNYYTKLHGQHLYTTWKGTPKGLQFSVIDYKLPNNAVVAVIGDWGTGMDDAIQLLKTLMLQHKPDAIVHLGDIYYSGTPVGIPGAPNVRSECQHNFLDVLTNVFNETLGQGKRIPVFTLPGNHEYYCGGVGYYNEVLPSVNPGITGAEQPASFFCLRTEDGIWQFLGMDTGYNDNNPLNEFKPTGLGPALHEDEQEWHNDKLDNFSGKTILLSHHQLFTANGRINGKVRDYPPNINTSLQDGFPPYFSTKIAAWLWGHEHNLVLYQNNLLGLIKGRLIGCSSYEETAGEDPYKVNYPGFPYLDPTKYRLGQSEGYMNHGYAIIDFHRASPNDSINISYYQYPSWGATKSNPPTTSQLMLTEPLDSPNPEVGPIVSYTQSLHMFLPGFGYLGPIEQSNKKYYPTINTTVPNAVSLVGGTGQIKDGDIIQIKTTEAAVQNYNLLGAWSTPALYYYTSGYPQQQWQIKKRDTSVDNLIRYGDDVYFINQSHSGQWLCDLYEIIGSGYGYYLTTRVNANKYWKFKPIQLPSIMVRGTLTAEGIECQAMRSLDDNKLYTLTGNLQGFKTGDKVEVTGKVAHFSTCQQGTTIVVDKITKL